MRFVTFEQLAEIRKMMDVRGVGELLVEGKLLGNGLMGQILDATRDGGLVIVFPKAAEVEPCVVPQGGWC